MDPDIDSDLKKARAFLVAFSTAVLLAWYFSADLKAINIIGFSLKIRENTHNLWLVIAVINLHFLLRYIQKLPAESRLPDEAMLLSFERALISHVATVYHKLILEKVKAYDASSLGTNQANKVLKIYPNGQMRYRMKMASDAEEKRFPVARYRLNYGHEIRFAVTYTFLTAKGGEGVSSGYNVDIKPNRYAVWHSQIFGFLRGIIFTPWMSDYILPAILGVASIVVAACSWWVVNY
ncbi:hypothetical protein E8F11_06285 [Pseudomonas sp. BN417]|uniref:hypothetical protein n=1 Tax=Pseudomonas sp. BN417 TaxID=2567890 RepID=UPI002454B911|nr:hypothetical protein [Pseudomonas sp. BN417]MDH4554787.1 hypothetical protein [Pseudomonas sp. BN417]